MKPFIATLITVIIVTGLVIGYVFLMRSVINDFSKTRLGQKVEYWLSAPK